MIIFQSKYIKYFLIILFCILGIYLRYFYCSLGSNYDFESYCIVGDIMSRFHNVYAETQRYNYAPIFMLFQGAFYSLAKFINPDNYLSVYRNLIVGLLTLADFGIAWFIAKKYSLKMGVVFFLNPVSLFITGFHNQFDNISIFLILLSTFFYNEDSKFSKKDFFFILFVTASLLVKHVMFALPFFLMYKPSLPLKKKLLYIIIPISAFLLSFLPFILWQQKAMYSILSNVFLYKSFDNSPFINLINQILGVNLENQSFPIFIAAMLIAGIVTRNKKYEYQLLIYFITLVAFTSALANQYIVIPMVSLCVLETGVIKYFYMFFMMIYFSFDGDGLCLSCTDFSFEPLQNFMYALGGRGIAHRICFFLLFMVLMKEAFFKKYFEKK